MPDEIKPMLLKSDSRIVVVILFNNIGLMNILKYSDVKEWEILH